MPTFWSPNTLPDKKIPTVPSQAIVCLMPLIFWQRDIESSSANTIFLCHRNLLLVCRIINNLTMFSPLVVKRCKKIPLLQACLLQLDLGRRFEVPCFHFHPSNSSSTTRILQVKIQMLRENHKAWDGEQWLQSLPVVGAAPLWGNSILLWNREVRFFLSLCQDKDSRTKTYIQT